MTSDGCPPLLRPMPTIEEEQDVSLTWLAPVALDRYRAEYPGTPLHSGLRSRIGAGEKPKAVAKLAFFAIHKCLSWHPKIS